jgi:hypothetical protein
MVIAANGNVGIGTTTPVSLLSVGTGASGLAQTNVALIGNSNAQALGLVGDATSANVNFYATGTTTRFATLKGGSTGVGSGGFAQIFTSDVTGAVTSRLYITESGNTGIGTTSPWGLLSVNPNALGSGVPEFVIGSSTATHFVVSGAGNVGIGTTSPYARLSVAGSAVLGGFNGASISINNGAASDAYLYFDGAMHFTKNGTGDRITVLDGGNVGVSSSTPGTILSIGTANGINFSTTATSTFGSTGGGINIASGCFAVNGTCVGRAAPASLLSALLASSRQVRQ